MDEFKQKVGMLRQWLNEDRITDPTKLVTNDELLTWLSPAAADLVISELEGLKKFGYEHERKHTDIVDVLAIDARMAHYKQDRGGE